MKISYNWLNEFIEHPLSPNELAQKLTAVGLEVESFEKMQNIKGGLEGLIVGHVIKKEKHPDADRLSVTKVNIGNGSVVQIVCGAPNVACGQKVIVAPVGAYVHPIQSEAFQIRKAKIRGVISEGMICSGNEVGLNDDSDGILVLNSALTEGTALKDVYEVYDDYIFEIGLTPNRVDASSHKGVARDLHAVLTYHGIESKLKEPEIYNPDLPGASSQPLKIRVENSEDCPRYSGICMSGVKVTTSPEWMQKRLRLVGIRPVNNLVDIGNYVMLEYGQPLHFFDADKISGNEIIVRKLNKGSRFFTLDEIERTLTGDELMICNHAEPMCIAGVFGGLHSGITDNTKNIFIESAKFNASTIRKGSKQHGLKTEASYRFERGTDPNNTLKALQRAIKLVLEISGGELVSSLYDFYPNPVVPHVVDFSVTKSSNLLGYKIGFSDAKNVFNALGYTTEKKTDDVMTVYIPTYKSDIFNQADLDEEVLRIMGYDKIPLPLKASHLVTVENKSSFFSSYQSIAALMKSRGYTESMNNSLTQSNKASMFWPADTFAVVKNPLSIDLDILRPSLIISGLETIQYNLNRQQENLQLFEIGKNYCKKDIEYIERYQMCLFYCGDVSETTWINKQVEPYGFYVVKSESQWVINVLADKELQMNLEKSDGNEIFTHCFHWMYQKKPIATFGLLNKKLCKTYSVSIPVWCCEIDFQALLEMDVEPIKYKAISKFPEVRRDLSMILSKNIPFEQLKELAFLTETTLLKKVEVFDVYEGEKIEAGKKSYALSFVLQDHQSTLTEDMIESVMKKLMFAYENKLGAVIRRG